MRSSGMRGASRGADLRVLPLSVGAERQAHGFGQIERAQTDEGARPDGRLGRAIGAVPWRAMRQDTMTAGLRAARAVGRDGRLR
jgi:hypothetical protein